MESHLYTPFKDLLVRNKLIQENLSDILSIKHTSPAELIGSGLAQVGRKNESNKRVSWAGSDRKSAFPIEDLGSQLVVSSLNSHEIDRNQDAILMREVARRVDRNAAKRSKRKLRAKVSIDSENEHSLQDFKLLLVLLSLPCLLKWSSPLQYMHFLDFPLPLPIDHNRHCRHLLLVFLL